MYAKSPAPLPHTRLAAPHHPASIALRLELLVRLAVSGNPAPPGGIVPELFGEIGRTRIQVLRLGLAKIGECLLRGWAIGYALGELGLNLPVEGEIQEVVDRVDTLSALHDRPIIRRELAAFEDNVDGCALFLRHEPARADRAADIDLARSQQLNGLGVIGVPLSHERPEPVHRLPGAFSVERV